MTENAAPMLSLHKGIHQGLEVVPRWPSRLVCIDPGAWNNLLAAQHTLPAFIRLIVTRAYEPRRTQLGVARTLFRTLGISLFATLYHTRRDEMCEIFGANGHDIDGTHVDVSIRLNGRRLRFLPLGVFTPGWLQKNNEASFYRELECVKSALRKRGFHIHKNPTESLQIHCDFAPREQKPANTLCGSSRSEHVSHGPA